MSRRRTEQGEAAQATPLPEPGEQDLLGNQAISERTLAPGAPLTASGTPTLAAAEQSAPARPEISREAYDASMRELQTFLRARHTLQNYTPPTGTGAFDASYDGISGVLTLTCRVAFEWLDADPATYPGVPPAQLAWSSAEQEQFREGFLRVCSQTWSGQHQFWCQRQLWEALSAITRIEFVEDKQRYHHRVEVTHIPPDTDTRSYVGRPGAAWGDGRIVDPWTETAEGPPQPVFRPGSAHLDSDDLNEEVYPTGRQITAVHEAGHMLGLGDEYQDADDPQKRTNHDALVRREFGHGVPLGDDGRIMSTGMDIGPEHGVTFLDALRKVTDMEAWGFEQLPLTPGPGPELGDSPVPPSAPRPA